MADQPNLGYAKTGQTDLDTFNQWFRARPEYAAKLAEFGQNPANVHLSDDQKQQMVKLAQSLGAVVDEGGSGQEVDDSGNFRNKSHKLKTGLIIAGIAGAALLTAGAAGAFGGAALAGGEGASAAAGAGAGLAGIEGGAAGLSSGALTALGTGAMSAVPVAAGAGAATGAGVLGLSAIEGGLPAGLGADAVGALGTGAMSAVPVSSTAAGIAGAVGDGAWDAAGNFIGDSSVSSVAPAGSGLGSTLGKGLGTFGDVAGSVGQAIGKANTAAGQDRLNQENLGLTANGQNISGQSAFEQELMNRAKEEDVQRTKAGKDVYRASYNANPRVSPFDPAGAPTYSKQYTSVAQALADQGEKTLSTPAQYGTGAMPALKPYNPLDPKDVQGATNTQQGTLSKVGDYLGPALSTAQLIARMWK